MKHLAPQQRRIPVLSTVVTVAGVIVYAGWEVLDDLADWLSRSRAALVVGKAVVVVAVVVVVALLAGCGPRDTRPGPVENTALAVTR